MPKLEDTLVFAQYELRKGHRYYLYRSQEEYEGGYRKIGGVYILQKEIGKDAPKKMKLQLEWSY